ncbi:Uncharacterized protein GBIM_09006 [Gryllus bimaculatus]|nr:Uncharacterized protein GBIM_09006 [Gryllus bimaculatus]
MLENVARRRKNLEDQYYNGRTTQDTAPHFVNQLPRHPKLLRGNSAMEEKNAVKVSKGYEEESHSRRTDEERSAKIRKRAVSGEVQESELVDHSTTINEKSQVETKEYNRKNFESYKERIRRKIDDDDDDEDDDEDENGDEVEDDSNTAPTEANKLNGKIHISVMYKNSSYSPPFVNCSDSDDMVDEENYEDEMGDDGSNMTENVSHSKAQKQTKGIFKTNISILAIWIALLECLLGIRIVVNGDPVASHEHSLLIMNHRTRTDWNFLWAAMFHASQPLAHRMKFVLKDPIRHIPGPGWVMQLTCFMFIHRNWEQDKHLLAKALDYFCDIKHTCQILLFPEGTDLTESSRRRSHEFAKAHGLKHYTYVLHPKTTGFVFLVQRMRQNQQLDAVYDFTVGYPFHIPQQETDLLKGNFPQEVHFTVRRFANSSLPGEDSELRKWLSDVWCEKERTLHDFYSCGHFKQNFPPAKFQKADTPTSLPDLASNEIPSGALNIKSSSPEYMLPSPDYSQLDSVPSSSNTSSSYREESNISRSFKGQPLSHSSALYLSLLFWTLLSLLLVLGLALSHLIRIWVAVNCILFVTLSIFTEGTHLIEISLFRLKQKYFAG